MDDVKVRQQGDEVRFRFSAQDPWLSGTIVGVATTRFAIIGCSWIVRLNEPLPGYHYECLVAFDSQMEGYQFPELPPPGGGDLGILG